VFKSFSDSEEFPFDALLLAIPVKRFPSDDDLLFNCLPGVGGRKVSGSSPETLSFPGIGVNEGDGSNIRISGVWGTAFKTSSDSEALPDALLLVVLVDVFPSDDPLALSSSAGRVPARLDPYK
jgi:hypothetical protein